jgi:hypothetical protein
MFEVCCSLMFSSPPGPYAGRSICAWPFSVGRRFFGLILSGRRSVFEWTRGIEGRLNLSVGVSFLSLDVRSCDAFSFYTDRAINARYMTYYKPKVQRARVELPLSSDRPITLVSLSF